MRGCAHALEKVECYLLTGGGVDDVPLCRPVSHAWLTENGPACAVVPELELGYLGQGFPLVPVSVHH